MELNPNRFFQDLERRFPQAKFLIAYSGGRDSSVLLHLCAHGAGADDLPRLDAVHVNHGLHPEAGRWVLHCKTTCEKLGVRYHAVNLNPAGKTHESPEEAARNLRYRALLELVSANTVVLTAQHMDDQAETLLLQMLRGAGLKGLSAMPVSTGFGAGILHRPLLRFSRQALQSYAGAHSLEWVEDPSNLDTRIDRNYLRHEVIPRITQRWPGMAKTVARAAGHCAEAQSVIDVQIETWCHSVIDAKRNTILLDQLAQFDEAQQRLILRHWIRKSGFRSPNKQVLLRLASDVIAAARHRVPTIHWTEAEVRRYRNELFIMRPLKAFDLKRVIRWSVDSPLPLPELGGSLECRVKAQSCSGRKYLQQEFNVRFRSGGECCRLPGRSGSRSLKNIFQERGIPPWRRDRIPLIYLGQDLVAVGDLLVCDPFQTWGIEFHWVRNSTHGSCT